MTLGLVIPTPEGTLLAADNRDTWQDHSYHPPREMYRDNVV